MDRLLKAGDIITTLAAVGGVFGWIGAMVARYIFRRRVSFQDWSLQAAGYGGMGGLILAAVYLLS